MNYILQRVKQLLKYISIPIIKEYLYFSIYIGAFIIGACCFNYKNSSTIINALAWTLAEIPIYFVISYALTLFQYLLNRFVPKLRVLSYIVQIFIVTIVLIEIYLLLNYNSYITTAIVTFVFQTNVDEVRGFFSLFMNTILQTLIGGSIIALLILGLILLIKRLCKYSWVKYLVLGGFCSVITLFTVPCFSNEIIRRFPYTAIYRLYASVRTYNEMQKSYNKVCAETDIVDVLVESPTIVLVLGESFSKYHSSLYDYDLETNPLLKRSLATQNLYVYTDVVSCYNKTNLVLKELFSLHSVDAPHQWHEFPIWAQIFRESGYKVSFISNQVTPVSDDWCSEMGIYFFQHPDVALRSFDYRNYDLYKYDDGILAELETVDNQLDSSGCELTILQLKGQHIYAKNNFPHDKFTKFTVEDYRAEKNFLNDSQMQEIADYDNATLYNDYVVSEIIK